MEQGEIYMADLSAGKRPVIILSRNELNRGNAVLVVPITSTRFLIRSKLPNCVAFRAGEFGLIHDCAAQCEQAAAIETSLIDTSACIGRLTEDVMRDVIRAVGYVMDAECEPS